ncbi:replication initiator protein A [Ectobacillus antri]|uniref:replication initiator protein A n=1 Tax=Ectobacillus antri TaxID=2486280 RepID=UPI000F59C4C4|nr:replication initiator protein A [Ectobacillus antri]
MSFNYYTKNDHDTLLFYQVPKIFYYAQKYKKVSAQAKQLYMFLLDRQNLSIENNWYDEEGRIFFISKVEEMAEFLGVSRKTAGKYRDELAEVGLYMSVQMGNNKANRSYIAKLDMTDEDRELIARLSRKYREEATEEMKKQGIIAEESSNDADVSNLHTRTSKNDTSGCVKITLPDVSNLHTSKTYINQTDKNKHKKNNTNLSIKENLYSRLKFQSAQSAFQNHKNLLSDDIISSVNKLCKRFEGRLTPTQMKNCILATIAAEPDNFGAFLNRTFTNKVSELERQQEAAKKELQEIKQPIRTESIPDWKERDDRLETVKSQYAAGKISLDDFVTLSNMVLQRYA